MLFLFCILNTTRINKSSVVPISGACAAQNPGFQNLHAFCHNCLNFHLRLTCIFRERTLACLLLYLTDSLRQDYETDEFWSLFQTSAIVGWLEICSTFKKNAGSPANRTESLLIHVNSSGHLL